MDTEVKRGLKSNSVRSGQHTYEVCDDNLDARIYTQGNPISGYRRLRDFGGKQMMSSSDSVCAYALLMIKNVFLEDKQRNLYFLS